MSEQVFPLLAPSARSMGLRNDAAVKFLWDEYRVAAQFAPTWDRAVENVELIRRKELSGTIPNQDDVNGLAPVYSRGGSPAHWMQMCGLEGESVPRWFRDELGLGSSVNVFDTTANLEKTNARRARAFAEQIKKLPRREVISRRVTG